MWSSAGKESTCNAGELSLIPGFGRSSIEGKGCPLQYSGLDNLMDCTVHGVTKSQTQLRDFHFTSQSQRKSLVNSCSRDPRVLETVEIMDTGERGLLSRRLP